MRSCTWIALALVVSVASAAPIKRASQPALSPDASQLAFSWQNDIWIASSSGGEARRLTVNLAAESSPRWFPDGSRIAFVSNRFGSNDLFSMRPDGSDIKRLTHDSANEILFSISPDGKHLLGHTNAWGRTNAFAVPIDGGDLIRLTGHPLEMQFYPSVSPDGKRVVYCGGGSAGNWRNPLKAGTDTAEIWIGDLGAPLTNNRNLTKDEHNDLFPMFAPDNTIVWMSNRSGVPNLWRMNANGGAAKQLTNHTFGTVRWPNMSANGAAVAYEHSSEIYIYDMKAGSSKKVELLVPDDGVLNPMMDIAMTSGAGEYVVSPDGKRGALSVRGDIFLIPERGGTTRRLTTHLALDFNPVWLDNRRILFVSGRNAKRDFFTVDIEGNERPFLSATQDVTAPALSPDGKTLAFHRGDREIVIMPVIGGLPRVVGTGGFARATQSEPSFSWSHDSKWITYSDRTERGSTIYAVEVASVNRTQVARVARDTGPPQFLPNGRGIFYTSSEFGGSDIVVVDLIPNDLTFSEDDLEGIDVEKPKPEEATVRIDPRGLEYRARRITSANAVGIAASPDSRSIWASVGGQLTTIPVTGGPATPVPNVPGGLNSFQLSANKAKVYLVNGGRPHILTLANGSVVPVNFNARMTVDRKAEELELFKEIWWAMDRVYYDANLHEKDWTGLKNRYSALVPFAFDRQDFYALMTEMVEELDSSHLSVSVPPGMTPEGNESTAFVGVEWDWAKVLADRTYVVQSVIPQSPADHTASRLMPGDRVLRVDGQALGRNLSFAEAMRGKANNRVRFSIEREGKPMEVAIRAISPGAATGLRYEEFVANRRAEVERLSGGKLTYFHISGMNAPATDRFFRESRMYAEGKQGAIIDVRWNGGGNTANRILAALRTEPWLVRKFRSKPEMQMTEEMFRGEAIEMPVALMTNQYSASNAEIFSEGFRRMKLGPIIGEATGGNVLTVGGRYALWDGGAVQIPFIGIVTVDGEPLERIGRRVDHDVRFDPNAWNAGRDNQLEVAVRELLKRVR